MELQPKMEPGLVPLFASGDRRGETNLKNKSISELVSNLRDTFLVKDFDRVEEALVAREANLKAEIGSLQEKVEVERMKRISVEEELKKYKEKSEKKAKSSYLKSLEISKVTLENYELSNKNRELECENHRLEALKKRWVDDTNVVDELCSRILELEVEMEALKKKLLDERDTIAMLRIENHRLEDEKREAESSVESWNVKFQEVNELLLRLENDTNTKVLMNGNTPCGGNTEGEFRDDPPGVPVEVKEEKEMVEKDVHRREFRSNTAGSAPSQRNEDIDFSLGPGTEKSPSISTKDGLDASARRRLGSITVIEIKDSGEDEFNSQRTLHGKEATAPIIADNEHPSSSGTGQQKNLPTRLAEATCTNINILDSSDTETSSSSSDSFDFDLLPLSIFSNLK